MAPQEQIHLYTNPSSAYTHRVLIALEEAGAKYTVYEIKGDQKPDWYFSINPVGKFPGMTYGGPVTTPDKPSPESTKLAESLVLVEFVADLFPKADLRPADPATLARARYFAATLQDILYPQYSGMLLGTSPPDALLEKLETLQARLPPIGSPGGEFAIGPWSLADVAIAPFLIRLPIFLENEFGKYALGEGKKTLEALRSPRFARLWKYIADLGARPSVKKTWDEAKVLQVYKSYSLFQRT